MRRPPSVLLFTTVLLLTAAGTARAQNARGQERVRLEFENGAAIPGSNDVRIPGNGGTTFSLTDDLESEREYFWRVRLDLRPGRRHVVSALAAPLRIDSTGRFNRPVSFEGRTFAPDVPVNGRYVFNSYRLTYRWEPVQTDKWLFGFGVTGKIRDAVTRLESAGQTVEKTNVGFVPLVNFKLERRFGSRVTLQVDGDALAAPQGRAEDIFAGMLFHTGRRLSLKVGYRMLEGGVDNDEVYTFALVHYVAAGAVLRF